MTNNNMPATGAPTRWVLIRDIAVFQVKLIIDGFRDLILVPISLITGVFSLLQPTDKVGESFYELIRVGKRSERWINLFGAAAHWHKPEAEPTRFEEEDIDRMVSRVERFIVDEYQKGGVTAQAKERLDQAIDTLGRLAQRNRKKDV